VRGWRYLPASETADDEYAESDDVTCLPRCRGDVTFRAADKRFSGTWQVVWSALSMTSSLVTLLTFVIDSDRFRYPERPVVFVALSRSPQRGGGGVNTEVRTAIWLRHQWRRSVVKYGGLGQSGSAIKLFQAFRKFSFTFHFLTQVFFRWWCETAELSNNSVEWKNVTF